MLDLYVAGESYSFLEDLALTLVKPAVQGEVVTISVADEIRKATGIDLTTEPIEAALPALALATECELAESPKMVIDRFVERKVEPQAADCAAIIHEFPAGGSEPCARVKPETVGVANRFEIFINGVEIAHGYEDEVDMDAFVARALAAGLFDDDQKRIVDGIRRGAIPPTVGMGIGVERLAMAIDECPEIAHYRFASDF